MKSATMTTTSNLCSWQRFLQHFLQSALQRRKVNLLGLVLVAVCLMPLTPSTWAQAEPRTKAAPRAQVESKAKANAFVGHNRGQVPLVNLNQAIRIVQEESGGQVLAARSFRGPDGKLRYRVRVLIDGQRVTTLVVDQNGRLRRVR